MITNSVKLVHFPSTILPLNSLGGKFTETGFSALFLQKNLAFFFPPPSIPVRIAFRKLFMILQLVSSMLFTCPMQSIYILKFKQWPTGTTVRRQAQQDLLSVAVVPLLGKKHGQDASMCDTASILGWSLYSFLTSDSSLLEHLFYHKHTEAEKCFPHYVWDEGKNSTSSRI